MEGLDKTEKLHFGGGNTDWEERKLGRFKTSETRFVEIMEYVCKKGSDDVIEYNGIKDGQFKCHSLAERYEELLEQWFFEHQEEGPSLEQFFCIDKLEYCCAEEYFGKNCTPCPGLKNSGKSCFGRGRCKGSGNRSGNGSCDCDYGYTGKMCSNCDSNYYAISQNMTYVECKECFIGCASGCIAQGPKGCRACASGYTMDSDLGCQDIDECSDAKKCSKANEICINTQGSFECQCADGYKRAESTECELNIEEISDGTNEVDGIGKKEFDEKTDKMKGTFTGKGDAQNTNGEL